MAPAKAFQTVTTPIWGKPSAHVLQGNRLHLNHGPIDLIIRAEGRDTEITGAYMAAIDRFQNILGELANELVELRKPLKNLEPDLQSSVAKRMAKACWPHRAVYITPMAAVAGSVADEIRDVMLAASPDLQTVFVNNGGDIALHVGEGATLKVGLVAELAKAKPDGAIVINHASLIRGIATSGWRGRSFSRGVADAVTVLAGSAAEADAAATMIANAVDVISPAIERATASSLDPDSDLGDILVTTHVGSLSQEENKEAIATGDRVGLSLLTVELISGYFIALQGEIRMSGGLIDMLLDL
jgi:uncharacterized protein